MRHRREDDEDDRRPAERRPSGTWDEPERGERERAGREERRGAEGPDARVASRGERGVEEKDGGRHGDESRERSRVRRDRDGKRGEPGRGPRPLEDVDVEREDADENVDGSRHGWRLQGFAKGTARSLPRHVAGLHGHLTGRSTVGTVGRPPWLPPPTPPPTSPSSRGSSRSASARACTSAGVDSRGLHHLVWEIVDNAVDEVINGYATRIEVRLFADGREVEISDNGRGIPVDVHPKYKKPALELILTTLHAGGKFEQGNYVHSGGLHGVGSSVVCAPLVRDDGHTSAATATSGGRRTGRGRRPRS